jgi:hypothetical protein
MLFSYLRLGIQSVLPPFFGFPDQRKHMTIATYLSCWHYLCLYIYILAADGSNNIKLRIENVKKKAKNLWLGNLQQKTASRPKRIRG